jgi:ribosomal protein S18 acetylase RimI-like enzyme
VVDQKIAVPLISAQIKHGAIVMAKAFQNNPFFTFVLPDVTKRARVLPWLFMKIIRYGQHYGKVYTTPFLDGITMWLGPKNTSLAMMGTLLTGLFLLPLKLSWRELQRSLLLSGFANQLHKKSVIGQHWYLYGLGVEPLRQGQGVGHVLLQPILAQADRESLVCYLDTNNEKNLPFYERNGFVVHNHGQASQTSPHTWTMLREPR